MHEYQVTALAKLDGSQLRTVLHRIHSVYPERFRYNHCVYLVILFGDLQLLDGHHKKVSNYFCQTKNLGKFSSIGLKMEAQKIFSNKNTKSKLLSSLDHI